MAVDVGLSGNTSRYWSVPDSAGLTLPNSDWSWLTLIYPQDAVSTKYIISKGLYFDINSFNLIVYSSDTGWGLSTQVHVLDGVIFTSTLPANQWYWAYATRRSGVLKLGYCPVGSSSVSEIGNVAISAEYNSSSPLEIGRRSDGEPTRYWQGRYSKAIFTPGYSVSKDEIAALCKGVLPEDMELSSFIRFYADFEHANKSVIVDRTGRYALTRNGTGWGANQKDPATRPRNVLLFNPALVAAPTAITFDATPSSSLTATGNLSTSIALAATPSSSLTASGALNTSIRFDAAPTASLSALSGLFTQINLASASAASLSSSASLNTSIVFSASPSISLSASASLLALSSGLSANPVATLTAAGSLSTSIYLSSSCNASLSASASLLVGSGNFASSASASLTASGALSTQITLSAFSSASVSSSASLQLLANNLASSASMGVVSSASLLTGIRLQASPNFSVSAIAGWGFTSGPAGSGYKAGLVKSLRNPVISKSSRNTSNRSRPTYQ